MLYKKSCPEGTPLTPVTYQFLEPTRMRVRQKDGTTILMGYGIGELIEVLEPQVQYLIVNHEILDTIPLADGSTIVEFSKHIRVKRVWNS